MMADASFIKLQNTSSGTVEVHVDALSGGTYKRVGDYTSDFSPADAGNGTWQLFWSQGGAPLLGFIKLRNTGSGTVEVHVDALSDGTYKRVGDYTSDFSPADAGNGTWQLFGFQGGAPMLGFIKLSNTAGTVEVHVDALSGGTYKRVGDYTSDFSRVDAGNGSWQLFGYQGGAPLLGFMKLRSTGSGTVEVHVDALSGGTYERVGDYTSDFSPADAGNGTWQLFGFQSGAPMLGFIELSNTAGTVEVDVDALSGGAYKRVGDYTSDFSPADASNGTWQLWTGIAALVLSGGASHGDFQVGAVRRLFEAGFQPDLIVSASVGSINAIKIAEQGALAATGEPSGLENIWLGLQNNASMYTDNSDFSSAESALSAGFSQIESLAGQVGSDVNWRNWAPQVLGDMAAGGTAGAFLGPVGAAAGTGAGAVVGLLTTLFESGSDMEQLGDAAQPVLQGLQSLLEASSIYSLDPVQTLLFNNTVIDPDKVEKSLINLLMATVSLETGDLRYVTGEGAVMNQDTTTPYRSPPVNACGSEAANVQSILNAIQAAYKSAEADGPVAGGQLRPPPAGLIQELRTELAKAQAALAACQAAAAASGPQPVTTDARTAALASASIPMIFQPVQIGVENYVDGGTRSQVPISGAIAAGATSIWAVDCNYPSIGPATDPFSGQLITSFDGANFLQIADRAAGQIMPYQMELTDDATVSQSGTVILVQPEWDAHNAFTIDPGLILIRIAHGYMRTDDTMLAQLVFGNTLATSVNAISEALYTTNIVQLRTQIWETEYQVVEWNNVVDADGTVETPTPSTTVYVGGLSAVRQLKRELQQLVTARTQGVNLTNGSPIVLNGIQLNTLFGASSPGGRIPEQPTLPDTWWLQWEAHQPPLNAVFTSPATPELWDASNPFTPIPIP
jgi:predicted acylesterase/phospholipase RssA